jgi:hypothetical protein
MPKWLPSTSTSSTCAACVRRAGSSAMHHDRHLAAVDRGRSGPAAARARRAPSSGEIAAMLALEQAARPSRRWWLSPVQLKELPRRDHLAHAGTHALGEIARDEPAQAPADQGGALCETATAGSRVMRSSPSSQASTSPSRAGVAAAVASPSRGTQRVAVVAQGTPGRARRCPAWEITTG